MTLRGTTCCPSLAEGWRLGWLATVRLLALAVLLSPLLVPPSQGPRGWFTTADGVHRLAPLALQEVAAAPGGAVSIAVDPATRGQVMDGFGAALTESSAHLLMQTSPAVRASALQALFDPERGAGISLVRLPLGASDFALSPYTYDDVPAGRADPGLRRFGLARDRVGVLPVLRQAQRINPALRVMATPWSAPAWMKDNGSLTGGGRLLPRYLDTYARYLARAVSAWRDLGVPVRWLTLQNEPRHQPDDYPGMLMDPDQQGKLAVAVRAELDAAGLDDVLVLGYDHNWDDPSYPDELLSSPPVARALAGTAWHCYAGTPAAQAVVHTRHPREGNWLTECSGTLSGGGFGSDLAWGSRTLLVEAVRSWSRSVLWWNLVLNPRGGPHTGGCSDCRGVLTLDAGTGQITRNVEWDVLALPGRVVQPGAVRIGSSAGSAAVLTVAWQNPDGSHALVATNDGPRDETVILENGHRFLRASLPAGATMSLRW